MGGITGYLRRFMLLRPPPLSRALPLRRAPPPAPSPGALTQHRRVTLPAPYPGSSPPAPPAPAPDAAGNLPPDASDPAPAPAPPAPAPPPAPPAPAPAPAPAPPAPAPAPPAPAPVAAGDQSTRRSAAGALGQPTGKSRNFLLSLADWKAVVGLIVTPLLFLCSYYDKPFTVWSLLHPKLPVMELPEPHIDMREAEKKLEKLMETSRFVLVDGVPGSGKSTAVVNAARQRGSGVFYFSVSSTPSTSSLPALQADLDARFRSPMRSSQEHSLGLQSGLRELAATCKRYTGKNLIIVVDNANRLSSDDCNTLLLIGKAGNDEKNYSLWLITSEDKGREILLQACEAQGVMPERYELPRPSKDDLCALVVKLLKCSREVADHLVYFCGRSFRSIFRLAKAMMEGGVLEFPNLYPYGMAPDEQDVWRLILDAGEDGVELRDTPGVPGLKDQLRVAEYKNCFDVSSSGPLSRLHPRTEHCRDVYRCFFAAMEYQRARQILAQDPKASREKCNERQRELEIIRSTINKRYESLLGWSQSASSSSGESPRVL